MDNNASQATTPAASPVAPAPVDVDASRSRATPRTPTQGGGTTPTGAAAPKVDRLIERATRSAHDAVDSVAQKVTSLSAGLRDGASKPGEVADEWLEAARDAVRLHPLATVAGALVIGAALLSLAPARRG
jgi:hypothetical protein